MLSAWQRRIFGELITSCAHAPHLAPAQVAANAPPESAALVTMAEAGVLVRMEGRLLKLKVPTVPCAQGRRTVPIWIKERHGEVALAKCDCPGHDAPPQ